jgi:tRNA (cmo5U34)-methyltransferase
MAAETTITKKGEGSSFSFSAIQDFDHHISREIRGYNILDQLVQGMSDAFMEDKTNVYDIGCSTGRLINTLAESLELDPDEKRDVKFTGFEPNPNFTSNFSPFNKSVRIIADSVDSSTKFENASLVTSIFTLQFVPTHLRPQILRNIYDGLNSSGAFIWAEKVIASDARLESLINGQHIALKREGSSAEDILNKDLRLRRIMRPLKLEEDLEMLRDAGFTTFETFWRVNNFVGIVAVKSH